MASQSSEIAKVTIMTKRNEPGNGRGAGQADSATLVRMRVIYKHDYTSTTRQQVCFAVNHSLACASCLYIPESGAV